MFSALSKIAGLTKLGFNRLCVNVSFKVPYRPKKTPIRFLVSCIKFNQSSLVNGPPVFEASIPKYNQNFPVISPAGLYCFFSSSESWTNLWLVSVISLFGLNDGFNLYSFMKL
ncbi:hypothetical protein NWE61_04095 [Mycoplasmopsis felis]|nr:hypothetical protein [Mycoplasmopsis felis]MCU9934308.1 hypothetical protein [Mycoplasmopsis felis]